MGSRIRENVKHFFECFCEVVPKTNEKDSWIIQQYPDTYRDEEVLKSVPKFAYPCQFENNIIQHYSFVLTDIESKWTFGFCRHDPKTETALVVLSYLPWHQAFYKFLNSIAILLQSPRAEDLRDFLNAVYCRRVPEPGSVFVVPYNKNENTFSCECPDKYKLPSIPEDRNLTEYYNAVEPNNMMIIFASMLNERRIIFTSKKLYRLSACVQTANDIIYPMIWQHIFIPVLPRVLIDYLLAPMPFLIGVPQDVFQTMHRSDIGDVVIFNADNNTIETPFDDFNSLPPEIVSSLKRQLRNKGNLLGDGVSRAFLRALVQLIGGYRDALRFQRGENITFNERAFIESRPVTMQPFLKKMLQLQIFQQFIEERLQMLNKGEGFTDQFEMEVHIYSEKSSSKMKQQYKEWMATMKKEGSAFFRSVKDKANPAMKTAVKSVKESGKGMKSAYKGLRSKFRESQGPEYLDQSMKVYVDEDKPRSAPNSPTTKRRPQTSSFGIPKTTYRKEKTFINSTIIDREYSPLSSCSTGTVGSPETPPDRSHSATPGFDIPNMDLLTEIKDLLHLQPSSLTSTNTNQSPPIDRTLKPVRSLDSFKQHNTILSSPSSSSSLSTNALGCQRQLSPTTDLFGSMPFVVSGGQNENGDAVFLVASDHCVDMVKLSPPPPPPPSVKVPLVSSPRRKKDNQSSDDLIRLDSTSDLDDFDPLYAKDRQQQKQSIDTDTDSSPEAPVTFTRGLSNPLYTYCVPKQPSAPNGFTVPNRNDRDQDLLQEYGLDFNNFQLNSDNVKQKDQWATFD